MTPGSRSQGAEGSVVRVLLVDDSSVTRDILRHLLADDPGIRVVGAARDGAEAVALTARLRPDVIIMDLLMPGVDGIEATRRIMANFPTPIVFVTEHLDGSTQHASEQALAAGALAVLQKSAVFGRSANTTRRVLADKLRAAAGVPVVTHLRGRSDRPGGATGKTEIIAIGGSAGGPAVLEHLLSALPSDYALAVIVVQHIADGFGVNLVPWLQRRCRLPVAAGTAGMRVEPGRVVVAPTQHHLEVRGDRTVRLLDGASVNGHRPSIDVTFGSVATVYRERAAGVLLSGVGTDGAQGLRSIRRGGGRTFVQDRQSAAVFGMPRAAIELGAAMAALPPAGLLVELQALHERQPAARYPAT